MLDLLLLFSTGSFIAAGAVVGGRLLLLSWRTRQFTDFLLGFSLFDLAVVSYPLTLVARFADLAIEPARILFVASTTARALGWAAVFVFTLRVFRPGVAWARLLTLGGGALLTYGFAATTRFALAAPDLVGLRSPANPILWLQAVAVVVYAWTGFEGFRCWQQARRRLALGLADPLVVNRFLLWGFVGVFAFTSVAPSFFIGIVGGSPANVPARFAAAIAGLACAISMQLAFLPPAAYRRWLTRNATA